MRVTLITGTSTGIGHATAISLAQRGYHVFAGMRNPSADASRLMDIAAQEDLKLDVIRLDVTDAGACEQAVETILRRTGRFDVLINNAGVGGGGPLEEVPEAMLRQIFETNFFGPMRLMRLVVPHMRETQAGAIVNISSIMGRLARAGASAYAGSKFALEAASESLAQELQRFNVRVILVEPGVVKTALHEKGGGPPHIESPYFEFTLRGQRLFGALLQKPSSPESVAETIHHAIETNQPKLRYLVGDDARGWMNGRQAMSDEDWVAVGRKMTLEEYADFYSRQFGIEI
jgi:NAD(P)-dependent dehydrogenase (short-subunit alcohol dehydrogenase family)